MKGEKLMELLENLKALLISEQKVIKSFIESKNRKEKLSPVDIKEFKNIQSQKRFLLEEIRKIPPLSPTNTQILELLTEIRRLLNDNSLLLKNFFPKSALLGLFLLPCS